MERQWLRMIWWSGALGLLAAAHLGRAVADVPVSIGGFNVPIWMSAAVGSVAAGGAFWLWWAAGNSARAARLPKARHVEHGKKPIKPEAPDDEHQADACCGLHAVVAADEGVGVDDQDG